MNKETSRITLTNARWLSADGTFEEGTIFIVDGYIVHLAGADAATDGYDIFDAAGHLVLPGAIDPHVHLRQPGQLYKEGVNNGSKAALRGGVTSVIDMPNNKPACSTAVRLRQKKEIFTKKSYVNWGLMFHATAGNRHAAQKQIKSAKVYMAKSSALPAVTKQNVINDLCRFYPLLSFHAEDETAFLPGKLPHHEKRPHAAVKTALQKIERALRELAPDERPRVVICHINTALETDWLRRMRRGGFDVWGEGSPHYFFFTQDDYLRQGTALQVNPAIKTEQDRQALRRALSEGGIDFIGTDHAPHARFEKESEQPPSGIAAIEWYMPLMLYLLDEGLFDWPRFYELTCANTARCYRIEKRDGIKEGNYADLVLVKRYEQPVKRKKIQTKSGQNVYSHVPLHWQVETVLVNGKVKFDGKRFYGKPEGMEI